MSDSRIEDWPETPSTERIRAELYDRERLQWLAPCDYADVPKGAVFRCVGPTGDRLDPLTLEVNDRAYAVAHDSAVPTVERGEGYGVCITVFDSLDEALRAGLS